MRDLPATGTAAATRWSRSGCRRPKTYEMQDFIDQMYGGKGKGWFRIVTDPAAGPRRSPRRASSPWCSASRPRSRSAASRSSTSPSAARPTSTRARRAVRARRAQHVPVPQVRQRALRGPVRLRHHRDDRERRPVPLHRAPSGRPSMQRAAARQPDRPRGAPRRGGQAAPRAPVPTYAADAQCNTRGLTRLGEYAVRGMMQRGMMVEVDHMSVKAAGRDPRHPRVGRLPRRDLQPQLDGRRLAGAASTGSAASWPVHVQRRAVHRRRRADRGAARRSTTAASGIGTDMNGVGGRPAPRGPDAPNPVTYPFRSVDGGSVIDKQVTGERVWDVNTDGAAHFGMVPDWIEQMRQLGGTGRRPGPVRRCRVLPRHLGRPIRLHAAATSPPGRAPRRARRSGTRSPASHPAAPSTATPAPAGPATGATTSGSPSTWAATAPSAAWSPTGRAAHAAA